MSLYKVTYTLSNEMYLHADSRSAAMAKFKEEAEAEIVNGNVLEVFDAHVEFNDGDKFEDLYSLRPGDEIAIEINGGHDEPATGRIVEIEYLDGDSGKLGAAKIVLDNGWKGIAKLEEIS